ncbi:hypothetical protein [Azospirillum sp. B510]|uniref:hypothetical protein n=1 Tax=Azospirillum sp. (strain B510) TaxID=137722 RepID=UPI0005AA0DF0|nr:hypothetical protein [Azospirillum sp. B510]
MHADDLGLCNDEFIEQVLALVEASERADPAKEADRRRAALERRMRANKAADSSIRAAMSSSAPPALKAAKLAAARTRKSLAAAEFNAAIAEDRDAWKLVIREAAARIGMAVVVLPGGVGEVAHFTATGRLAGWSRRTGNEVIHFDADGRRIGTTTLRGNWLVSQSADGVVIGKHMVKST